MQITQTETGWRVPVPDALVVRCIVDYAFTIDMQSQNATLSVRIGTDFTLQVGETAKVLSVHDTLSLGEALIMFNKRLLHLTANKNGDLELDFSDQIKIKVKPDQQSEAWDLTFSNGAKIVCVPGGKLAIWDPI